MISADLPRTMARIRRLVRENPNDRELQRLLHTLLTSMSADRIDEAATRSVLNQMEERARAAKGPVATPPPVPPPALPDKQFLPQPVPPLSPAPPGPPLNQVQATTTSALPTGFEEPAATPLPMPSFAAPLSSPPTQAGAYDYGARGGAMVGTDPSSLSMSYDAYLRSCSSGCCETSSTTAPHHQQPPPSSGFAALTGAQLETLKRRHEASLNEMRQKAHRDSRQVQV